MDRMRDTLARIAKQQTESRGGSAASHGKDEATPPAPSNSERAAPVPTKPKVLPGRSQRSGVPQAKPGSATPRPPATTARSVPRTPGASPRPAVVAPRSKPLHGGAGRAAPLRAAELPQPGQHIPPPVQPQPHAASAPHHPETQPPHDAEPDADALHTDRIITMPKDRAASQGSQGSQEARQRSPRPPVQPTHVHTSGDGSATASTTDARSPSVKGARGRGEAPGMEPLGDALQGYVAVLAERRRQRAAVSRDQGKLDQGAGGTLQPAKTQMADAACPLCGGAGYVRLDLPFGDPRFGQAIPCRCKEREIEERHQREEKRRLAELDRFFSLQPFAEKTFGTFDPKIPGLQEAYTVAHTYAEDPQGWLLLTGGYGTGKTHLAAAIAHERLVAGSSVYFAVVPELLDHLRAAFAPDSEIRYDDMFDKIREVELLVLDDLGAENGTAWATEKLFQLINYRYNYRMPTVITTNNTLHARMDDRVRSRLGDLSLVRQVAIKARDYRPHSTRGAGRG